jgi:hypothetical protein
MKTRRLLALLMLVVFLAGAVGVTVGQTGGRKAAKTRKIVVTSPKANEVIHSPLTVAGKAPGAWFFEATFPVRLLDGNGKEITEGVPVYPKVEKYWDVKGLVPFQGTLEFKAPDTATGTLVFQNDNPSGEPENQEEFRLPVRFK